MFFQSFNDLLHLCTRLKNYVPVIAVAFHMRITGLNGISFVNVFHVAASIEGVTSETNT